MKCEKCGNQNVRNVGKKTLVKHYEKDGSIHRGNSGRQKFSHENKKKYKCNKCGWTNEKK